jgi:hypothetical protein
VGVPAAGTTGQVLQKLSATSYDTGWLTLPADYITSVTAPLDVTSGNLSVNLSAYLPLAGGYITGDIQSSNGSGYRSWNGTNLTGIFTAGSIVFNDTTPGHGSLTVDADGITFYSSPYKQTTPFLGLAGYATEAWVTNGFAPIAAGQPTSGTVGQVLTKNSGTNYDSSWATLIPGDRYLTTSTTSLAIDNNNKTLTVGTGLSYTPQQDVVIAYDATHHMHAQVLTYNSGTGVMTVDVQSHTGTGTFAVWTVNVGGTVPEASVVWGDITGVLGNQTDLATALNGKLEVTTAASTYQTLSGMSSYLTSATAASTYFTIASAAGKANLSGATFTSKVNFTPVSGAAGLNIGIGGTNVTATTAGDLWIATGGANLNFRDGTGAWKVLASLQNGNVFTAVQTVNVTSASTALLVKQYGAGDAFRVEDENPESTPFVINQHGKVGIGVTPDTTAALKVDTNGIMFGDGTTQTTASPPFVYDSFSYSASLSGAGYLCSIQPGQIFVQNTSTSLYTTITADGITFPDASVQTTASFGIPDAPVDGNYYVRKDGAWVQCTVVSIYDSITLTSYNCLTV